MAECLLRTHKTLALLASPGKEERECKSLYLSQVIILLNVVIWMGFIQSIEGFREDIKVPYERGNSAPRLSSDSAFPWISVWSSLQITGPTKVMQSIGGGGGDTDILWFSLPKTVFFILPEFGDAPLVAFCHYWWSNPVIYLHDKKL